MRPGFVEARLQRKVYEQYKDLRDMDNLLVRAEEDSYLITSALKQFQAEQPYVFLQPAVEMHIPNESRDITTAAEAIRMMTARAPEEVWGSISEEMRNDPKEMLQLISYYPEAFSIASPSLRAQDDFVIEALSSTPQIYDLLTPEQRQQNNIVDGYRVGIMQQEYPHSLCFYDTVRNLANMIDSRTGQPLSVSQIEKMLDEPWRIPPEKALQLDIGGIDAKHLGVYQLHPDCPLDKFYSVDGYQEQMSKLIAAPTAQYIDSELVIPPSVSFVEMTRNLYPEKIQELQQAERTAFVEANKTLTEHRNQLMEQKDALQQALYEAQKENDQDSIDMYLTQLEDVEWSIAEEEKLDEYREQFAALDYMQERDSFALEHSPLTQYINPYLLTEGQIHEIAQSTQRGVHYDMLSPAMGLISENGRSNFNSAFDVCQELARIEYMEPSDAKQEAIAYVWGNLSDELRNSKDEMLKLVTVHPEGLAQASPSIMTKEYIAEAMHRNPKVYDVLPTQMQKNHNVIDIYRDSLINPIIPNNTYQVVDGVSIAGYQVNPNCPTNQLYSPEAYQKVFEQILLQGGTSPAIGPDMGYHTAIGPALTYLAMARETQSHFAASYDQAEKEAFENVKEALKEKACSREGYELIDRLEQWGRARNIDIPIQEWRHEADIKYCQEVVEYASHLGEPNCNISTAIAHVVNMTGEIDSSTWEQHFDASTFWTQVGTELGKLEAEELVFADTALAGMYNPSAAYEIQTLRREMENPEYGALIAEGRQAQLEQDDRVIMSKDGTIQLSEKGQQIAMNPQKSFGFFMGSAAFEPNTHDNNTSAEFEIQGPGRS